MNADGSGERPTGTTGVPMAWLSVDELVVWDDEGLRAVHLGTNTVRSVKLRPPFECRGCQR